MCIFFVFFFVLNKWKKCFHGNDEELVLSGFLPWNTSAIQSLSALFVGRLRVTLNSALTIGLLQHHKWPKCIQSRNLHQNPHLCSVTELFSEG